MYEEAAASIVSWLTPSSLFIFINLVIAIIFITSRFSISAPTNNNNTSHSSSSSSSPTPQLLRSPSLLHRLTSFNYSTPTESTHHQPQLVSTPSLLQRVKSFNFSLYHHHQQTESENPIPVNNNDNKQLQEPKLLVRAPSLLQRSISLLRGEKEAGAEAEVTRESEETVEGRRPTTAPERRWLQRGEEEEVDAKADDFIKRFKKQLRLQRADSLLRYRREMLKSSSSTSSNWSDDRY